MNQDNSQSWVRISYGTIKHVVESIQDNTKIPADPQEEQVPQTNIKVVAARSKAKAEPQPRVLVGTTATIPIDERRWIDIEPSEQNLASYDLSKKVINLLRHNQTLQREEDGAIQFYKIKFHLRNHRSQTQHWSDDRWKACLAAGGRSKRRYQYCADNLGTIIYLRALQGQSGNSLIDPMLQDNVLIRTGIFPFIYHVRYTFNPHSIDRNGLLPGGQNLSRRQKVFFLPVDPRDESHRDPEHIDFSVPRLARYLHSAWKRHQDAVACREYTLPRDDPTSEAKGWIQGNTRIGPVLEVTTSFQHFKYGIEIRIGSVNQDNSQSWVRISYGTIKHVVESIQDNTKIPADPQEEQVPQTNIKVVAARTKAKAKPQPRVLVGTTATIPIDERRWIDIEPSEQNLSSYDLSKKVINLLRHNQTLQREDDGEIEFYKIKFYLRNHHSQIQLWSDDRWKACLAAGGGSKRRYQYCSDNLGTIIYLRALQGHSGSNLINPMLQDNVLIGPGIFHYIYHVGCAFNLHSIINNGLIPGGQDLSRRQTVFFLPIDPRDENH